jgi:hypothetical protein
MLALFHVLECLIGLGSFDDPIEDQAYHQLFSRLIKGHKFYFYCHHHSHNILRELGIGCFILGLPIFV